MTRRKKPESMEEIDEKERSAMQTNSDRLLIRLQTFHPDHDEPFIDDVKIKPIKKPTD